MKLVTVLLLSIFISSLSSGQEDKFVKAIEKNLGMMDTANSSASYQQIANNFERIANAEKNKWEPYYYAALCLTISSFTDSSKTSKDLYLEKAEGFITRADSLKPEDSEIYTMKGFVALARMAVDPMSRWQKYMNVYSSSFEKAKQLNPDNPRPIYLQGTTLLNTPEQFGGGKTTALPVLKEAKEKYVTFQPENSISPRWGEQQLNEVLKSIGE